MAFVRHLKKFVPRPGMTELFYEVICDIYKNNDKIKGNEKSLTLSKISEHNGRITKARELLLSDAIDPNDYKKIKLEAEEQITRLEAKLEELKSKNSQKYDIEEVAYRALENLNLLYLNADIEAKREISGSIFVEKWQFDGTEHRTAKINEAAALIYHINSKLQTTKSREKALKNSLPGLVPLIGNTFNI